MILNSNTTDAIGGLGQFAVGTFTADAVSQTLIFSEQEQIGLSAIVNGAQLRDVTPSTPPPSRRCWLSSALASPGLLSRGTRGRA